MAFFLVTVHLAANVVWIGAILSAALLLREAASQTDAKIAALGRLVYRRLAAPAFGISFLAGAARIALEPSYYLHLHWFHAKLTVALGVIVLHHVIGARVKRAETGTVQEGRNGAILGAGLFVLALAAVALVTYRTSLVP